jgi:3-hydroxymyristoyl/3-hydroxydecanoyl-(acyl carrier protein) dehydratase
VITQSTAFKNFSVQDQVATGKVPADSAYLNGHFPNMPVFPAVAIIDASLYFIKSALKQNDLYIQEIPSAKFLSPIAPEQALRIELQSVGDSDWKVEWNDEGSRKTLATLTLTLMTRRP